MGKSAQKLDIYTLNSAFSTDLHLGAAGSERPMAPDGSKPGGRGKRT